MQVKIAKAKPHHINYLIAKIKYPEAKIGADGWIENSDGNSFQCPDYCHDWEKAMKLAKEKGLTIAAGKDQLGYYQVASPRTEDGTPRVQGKNLIRTILRCYIMAELKSETAEIEVVV